MNNQFKPGDLALLVRSGAENNCKTVEVLQYLGRPETFEFRGETTYNDNHEEFYLIRGVNEPIVLRPEVQVVFGVEAVWEIPAQTHRLMPLQGDSAPERQKATEVPA